MHKIEWCWNAAPNYERFIFKINTREIALLGSWDIKESYLIVPEKRRKIFSNTNVLYFS